MSDETDIQSLDTRGPGEDPEDPYEDVDTSELPDWWQKAIELHEEYGLRPYRPPVFTDGAIVSSVVTDLEETYDVDIRFFGRDVRFGDDWDVYIDGELQFTIGRERRPTGHTVYEVDSEEFIEKIREIVQ